MCGIVGLFDMRGKSEVDRELLTRMNQTQEHRGPDEGEVYTEPGLGLGHRRLSIMDVASGQQPLFNEDGSVVVIFNGEFYSLLRWKVSRNAVASRLRQGNRRGAWAGSRSGSR